MKLTKNLLTGAVFSLATLFSASSLAATAQVNWVNPDNYRDLEPGHSDSKTNFQKRFFKSLEKHIQKLAKENLPPNYTLAVAVYDVDLSGSLNMGSSYAGMKMMRMVGEDQPPAIELGYIVVDENNKEVLKGAKFLKDKNFRWRRKQSKEFFHEKKLIEKWFNKELSKIDS